MEQGHAEGIRLSREEGKQSTENGPIHEEQLDPNVLIPSVTETSQHLLHPNCSVMFHTRITKNALLIDFDTYRHDKLPSLSRRRRRQNQANKR